MSDKLVKLGSLVGPTGSQYIQTNSSDAGIKNAASNIIKAYNIRVGDYTISTDTNTIWQCISDTAFSQGPSIKGGTGSTGLQGNGFYVMSEEDIEELIQCLYNNQIRVNRDTLVDVLLNDAKNLGAQISQDMSYGLYEYFGGDNYNYYLIDGYLLGNVICEYNGKPVSYVSSYEFVKINSGSSKYTARTNIDISGSTISAEGYVWNEEKNSFTEGNSTTTSTASGSYSHAEGAYNKANGIASHAEGEYSHAEADYSHAEGSSTVAQGMASHAEGANTDANGEASHTEGSYTTTYGFASHAEGEYTITHNSCEHAEGRYNFSNYNSYDRPEYATISSIGIGTSVTDRKNAFEVMQNGDIYIKGIGDYDGTNPSSADTIQSVLSDLTNNTAGYITQIPIATSTRLGVIKAGGNLNIDTNGKLTAKGYTWDNGSSTMTVNGQINASLGFYETSDIRKKNVIDELPLDKAYELINNCQSIIYTLKDNTDKQQVGLIAQEVQQYFPEVVSEDKDGYLSLDYAKLTAVIFRVLKDIIDRLSKLENK